MTIQVVNLINESQYVASLNYTFKPFEQKLLPGNSIAADLAALDVARKMQAEIIADSGIPLKATETASGVDELTLAQVAMLKSSAVKTNDLPVIWSLPTFVNAAQAVCQRTLATGPGEFDAVALVLFNSSASPVTLDAASVAVTERSDTIASRTKPQIGGVEYNVLAAVGTQNGFIPITFGGSASVAMAAGSLTNPSITISDFASLASIPRVDGGTLPLLMVSHYFNTRTWSGHQLSAGSEVAAMRALIAPHEWWQTSQLSASDGATDPTLFITAYATDTAAFRGLLGFIFRCRKSGQSVLFCGDSIRRGLGAGGDVSTNNAMNFVGGSDTQAMRTLVAANTGRPVGFALCSIGGRTTALYSAHSKVLQTALKPTLVVYCPYTPNDTPITAAAMNAEYGLYWDMVATCKINNAQLIPVTPVPYSGGNESFRQAMITRILSGDQDYIDANSVVYDADQGNKWKIGTTIEGTHPNAAGYALMTPVTANTLAKYIR